MSKKKEEKKSKQQKPKSTTVKEVKVPKPEETGFQDQVNLCDSCAYEFGECEGQPKFASDQDETLKGAEADLVIECAAYKDVVTFPTAAELAAAEEPAGPAPEAPKALDLPSDMLDDFGKSILHSRADEIREELSRRYGPDGKPSPEDAAKTAVLIIQEIIEREGGPTDGLVHLNEGEGTEEERSADVATMKADIDARPDLSRFANDEADYGNCASCTRPLKRTAYSRYVDAVRCTNPRCRSYRVIVKTVPSGVK